MLAEQAEFLPPLPLGVPLPEAEAVIFPQMLGEVYRRLDEMKALGLPVLAVTSEFGTVLMWDWEITSYLRAEGLNVFSPYSLAQTRQICQTLGVKRDLKETKFLVFQDNPGEGMQADIFKRFYWWEDECLQRMMDKFGITLVKRSFRDMAAAAKAIPDGEAEAVLADWTIKTGGITSRALKSAVKIYMKVKEALDEDPAIKSVGINCLNESRFSDTTPCLAWNMLYEERGLIWGCEADTVSMMTKYLLHKSLDVPIMMTNMYPFLMGDAALKHERISHFPDVEEPENHILAAHCGYLGVVPTSFATEWSLEPKVLAIVDDNATAIDARLPEGPMTLAKLQASIEKVTVVEGNIEGYVQYPGSDCRNGAVIKINNGKRLVNEFSSHHYLMMTGHNLADIEMVAKIYDLEVEAF